MKIGVTHVLSINDDNKLTAKPMSVYNAWLRENIAKKPLRTWSAEEDATIRKHWGKGYKHDLERKLGMTGYTVSRRAEQLGLGPWDNGLGRPSSKGKAPA